MSLWGWRRPLLFQPLVHVGEIFIAQSAGRRFEFQYVDGVAVNRLGVVAPGADQLLGSIEYVDLGSDADLLTQFGGIDRALG